MNAWADTLGFWGTTGQVVIAPYGTCKELSEIFTIHFETQKMSPLFEILSPDLLVNGSGEISASAISPDNDAFAITLGSLYVLRFHVAVDAKFPVPDHDCDLSIPLAITPASIQTMEWTNIGIILGDNFGRCYIVGDDFYLVFNQASSISSNPLPKPIAVCACLPGNVDASENNLSFQSVCEVFTWIPRGDL